MSKFCPKCGNALPDGAVFCANCGSAIAAAPAQSELAANNYEAPAFEAPAYAAPAAEQPAYADPFAVPETEAPAKKEKKPFPVKMVAIIVAAVVVVGALVAWLLIANPFANPEAALKDYFAYKNNEELSLSDERAMLGGLGGDSLKKIYSIYEETALFESAEESWENDVKANEERYGEDWEFSYDLEEKYTSLPEAYLLSAQSSIYGQGDSWLSYVKDMDEDDIEAMAERLDIDEDEVESLLSAIESFAEELMDANVTDVCELTYYYVIEGEDVDEDEIDTTDYRSFTVYKVNGKWVSSSAWSTVYNRVRALLGTY